MTRHLVQCTTATLLLAWMCVPSVNSRLLAAQAGRIPANGTQIQIKKVVSLSTEIAGQIIEVVPQNEGVQVRQGDILFRLNDAVIRKEYERALHDSQADYEIEFAETSLEEARIDLEEKVTANAEDPGTFAETEIRQANLEIKRAEAQLKKATHDKQSLTVKMESEKLRLDQTVVRSTIDGVVTQINHLPGESASPGDPIITITDLSNVRAVLNVDYSFRDQIKVGTRVEILVPVPGTLRSVSSNPATTGGASTESAGSVLEGFPGRRNTSTTTPERPAPAPAAARQPADDEPGLRFFGTVYHILPTLVMSSDSNNSSSRELQIWATIPNRQDESGRFLLQEGVPAVGFIITE